MKKAVVLALAAGAVTGIALTAAAWYAGGQAEQALRAQLPNLQVEPTLHLELADYERGLFRSQAVLVVRFADPDSMPAEFAEPLSFRQPFTVVHGPILWDSAFAFRPAAFGIKSHLDAQPDWPADLKTLLADERLRLAARIGFDGSSSTRLIIDKGDLQLTAGQLLLERGELQFDFDPADRHLVGDFNWPGFQLSGDQGDLHLRDMRFHWAGSYFSQNLQLGAGEYQIAEIRASQAGQEAFVLSELKVSGEQKLDASGEQVSSVADLTLADVSFMGQPVIHDGLLHMELNKLSVAALKKLDAQPPTTTVASTDFDAMIADFMALFEHGAEFKIDPLRAEVQGEPVHLTLLATLPPSTTVSPTEPMQLFEQAAVDLTLKASPTWLAAWTPIEWQQQLAIDAADDSLIVSVRNGVITVNGKPWQNPDAELSDDELPVEFLEGGDPEADMQDETEADAELTRI